MNTTDKARAMNLRLCEADGYENPRPNPHYGFDRPIGEMNGQTEWLPNFFDPKSGLIHCHRLEAKLTEEQQGTYYYSELSKACGQIALPFLVSATADQRARALHATLFPEEKP